MEKIDLEKRAEQKAQELIARVPVDADEAYVLLLTHVIALVGLARHDQLDKELLLKLVGNIYDRTKVFDMRSAAVG